MTPGVRPLVAGNWKMNGLTASLGEIEAMRAAVDEARPAPPKSLVCPPATLLAPAAAAHRRPLALGAQDCHPEPSGAYTGDISAPMLKDAGGSYVIVGHSERRAGHGESDALVRAKAEAARPGRPDRRSSASARRARNARPGGRSRSSSGQVPARCRRARRRDSRRRLRAGLGDRHRPDSDRRPMSRRCMPRSASCCGELYGAAGARNPHSLRRLGQAVKRRANCWASPMSTARWSAARA